MVGIKLLVTRFLERRTRKFLNKTSPKIIVVTGSIGKTSTTQAIAKVLRKSYKVATTRHNYNTPQGVVMSIFGYDIRTSLIGWVSVCGKVFLKSFRKPNFEVVVLELGTDGPGQLRDFAYLAPDIAVVTGIAPEHMEFFKTLEAVAIEELTVASYSKQILVNADLTSDRYIKTYLKDVNVVKYGEGQVYHASLEAKSGVVQIHLKKSLLSSKDYALVGVPGRAVLAASAAVADMLGMDHGSIQAGLLELKPVPGRMSRLNGVRGSTIIDDSYNSSPEAAKVALDYLYSQNAPQRIALLGMMNELGSESARFHSGLGEYCDPSRVDLVVTLGEDANSYLASAAEKRGCVVIRTHSPVEAAKIIAAQMKEGAAILAKGSQNGVYAEEAVKLLLADSADISRLVRQHDYWPAKKAKQFPELAGM